jgi:hypothetical protein
MNHHEPSSRFDSIPAYLTFQALIAPGTPPFVSAEFPPGYTTLANMIHFYVGVASNPKLLWSTVLSSSAQRDVRWYFGSWSDTPPDG